MNELNINEMLERKTQEQEIKNILQNFDLNITNPLFKKGIYIYGNHGTGKTTFITNILTQLNYDIIRYDAGDIRNKNVIEDISKHNMSNKNVISLFEKKFKKIAIIMDEIDGMSTGDKGGINSLIKLIRPKKTKKQKNEEDTLIPIICIGNYKIDKKIKELMKVCNVIELISPTEQQITNILKKIFPDITLDLYSKLVAYIQHDLRKITNLYNLYKVQPTYFTAETIENILQIKSYNYDTKKITNKLLNEYVCLNEHNKVINDTDRTSVGLLWHENIIDFIEPFDKKKTIPFYLEQLDNICFADYIDRITFQKQIWQFNEMSSLIKSLKNNKRYHECFSSVKKMSQANSIRFTKVLTKYSTEYNNSLFIQNLCQKLSMDKKDLFGFFFELTNMYENSQILTMLVDLDISKLDINRIYKYIEKYIKTDAKGTTEKEIEEEDNYEEVDDVI
jgi:nicotinamide riboside kinase